VTTDLPARQRPLPLTYRFASAKDVPRLAAMNRRLIQDEGHGNPMTLSQLEARLSGWLSGGSYSAILFHQDGECVAYALLRDTPDYVYLRHFYVERTYRRRGIGREAVGLLVRQIIPADRQIRLEVLTHNERALRFWRAVGFADYAITMQFIEHERRRSQA
jgi:ribosomal protein S18 acetylase RimI-like enzyme